MSGSHNRSWTETISSEISLYHPPFLESSTITMPKLDLLLLIDGLSIQREVWQIQQGWMRSIVTHPSYLRARWSRNNNTPGGILDPIFSFRHADGRQCSTYPPIWFWVPKFSNYWANPASELKDPRFWLIAGEPAHIHKLALFAGLCPPSSNPTCSASNLGQRFVFRYFDG